MSRPISSLPQKYQEQAEKLLHPKPLPELKCPGPQRFTIHIEPMGKPRMTQQDKWRKRPVTGRYWDYKAEIRAACPNVLPMPTRVSWTAFISMPDSWSEKKKAAHTGQFHRARPDRDNIDKGICDALWDDDQCIAFGTLAKYWDDGKGARIELEII